MTKYYLTTAIDYSNGDPHLGHALEKIGADAIARWQRMRGHQVHFLMGMDEHSQSVIQAAARAEVSPKAWVDEMSARFSRFWSRLDCSHDDWIRTTEPRHHRTVTELLTRISRNNPEDLFESEYQGLYCDGCEEFKVAAQIIDGRCEEHPTLTLRNSEERNHFFRLSQYGPKLHQLISSGEFQVDPAIRRNEVLRLIEAGLQDISVSRRRSAWGIPFPGDPEQTVYVWFDALINYLSATGFPDPEFTRLWPADLHIIGKGITRFHCVIWPAMLLAAGVPLPKRVWAHGYVQWGGAKMSKTAGTAVDLDSAIDRYGSDALRWFLLREIGFEADGDFTWDRFDTRYLADLADGLGNLAARSLAMIAKYRDGVVPRNTGTPDLETQLDAATTQFEAAMDAMDLRTGATTLSELVATANQQIVRTAPWNLAKTGDDAALDQILVSLAQILARLALMSYPFMPRTAVQLLQSLGLEQQINNLPWGDPVFRNLSGRHTSKPPILFPKPNSATPS